MRKKLIIKAFDAENNCKRTIVCGHLDATKNITVLSESYIVGDKCNIEFTRHIIDEIDHFNIFEGLVTIYYKTGCFLEIIRSQC